MSHPVVIDLWYGMERDWDHDLISSVAAAATVLVNEYDLDNIREVLYTSQSRDYRW